jgi:hypothetical protein
MRKHRDALSKTTLKNINRSKYYKVTNFLNSYPDITKQYEFRQDGWRRKKVIENEK